MKNIDLKIMIVLVVILGIVTITENYTTNKQLDELNLRINLLNNMKTDIDDFNNLQQSLQTECIARRIFEEKIIFFDNNSPNTGITAQCNDDGMPCQDPYFCEKYFNNNSLCETWEGCTQLCATKYFNLSDKRNTSICIKERYVRELK